MKRSRKISLVLLGSMSAGALSSCGPSPAVEPKISPDSVYPNDYHLAGTGYYHAPFHAFYERPYNDYDPVRKQYYYGGQWGAAPYRSIVNVSAPTAQAALLAENARETVERAGFGSTSSGRHTWS